MATVRVVLPYHLYTLAHSDAELELDVPGAVTLAAVLDALEAACPMLAGAVRDRATGQRRPLVRFYACQDDCSNLAMGALLPEAVATGREPLIVVGAIAGG
ncbi:MoaD/ThiS family protein [Thiobacillus sp.]|uniref:MoaD/ThiS family protein n=1 Tax=Thiobacillus sp. TaxID=924 RepID=UPI0025F5A02E|nr:MoaD/ThiS family protein [Thiobacillus sp.]